MEIRLLALETICLVQRVNSLELSVYDLANFVARIGLRQTFPVLSEILQNEKLKIQTNKIYSAS